MSTPLSPLQYRHRPSSLLASAIGVAISAWSSQSLAAQTTDDKTKASSEETDTISLDAVSVTAEDEPAASGYKVTESSNRRYTAPLRETPKTITVVTEQVIKDTGSLSLVDALRTTSGITFGAGEGGNPAGDRPIIRGFNSESDMFIDGLRDVASQTREIFNTEQIEISKGPGSAFVGAGSTGGSINMMTKTPKREDFINFSHTWGTDQTRRYTGDINQVLSDNVAFRLNVMKHDAHVAGRDEVSVSRWGVAPSLTIGFDTPTRLTMAYYHLRTDDMPDYGVPLKQASGTSKRTPETGGSKSHFYGYSSDYRHSTTNSGYFKFEHDFNENLTLTSASRLVRTTLDYVVTNPDDSRNNINNGYVYRSPKSRDSTSDGWVNQTDLRAKFNTWGIQHTMLVGIEASYEDVHNRPYAFSTNVAAGGCNATNSASGLCTSLTSPSYNQSYSGTITPGVAYTNTQTETKAGFLFDTLKFNDQWSLNLGIRYDDFNTKSKGIRLVNSVGQDFKYRNDTHFWSYQAGVVFNPLPNGSVYVAWSNSYNPVGETSGEGSDGISVANADLKPERNDNWELGTKWDFFNNRLGINAAVFRTKKKNARQLDQSGATTNIGETVVQGLELGASGSITSKWDVFANYTYLDSEIKKGGSTNIGTTANPVYVSGYTDGNHTPSTPRHTFSLWSTYHLFPDLTLGGGANFVDSRFGNAANTIEVPSYWRYDAMASYKVNKTLDFQLNIQNLTNKRYYDQVFQTHYAHVAPGRTALFTTNLHF